MIFLRNDRSVLLQVIIRIFVWNQIGVAEGESEHIIDANLWNDNSGNKPFVFPTVMQWIVFLLTLDGRRFSSTDLLSKCTIFFFYPLKTAHLFRCPFRYEAA